MPRPLKPFDPLDQKCIYPRFGRSFDSALQKSDWTPITLAKQVKLTSGMIREYRRGYSRPSKSNKLEFEKYLGTLDYSDTHDTKSKLTVVDFSTDELLKELSNRGFDIIIKAKKRVKDA